MGKLSDYPQAEQVLEPQNQIALAGVEGNNLASKRAGMKIFFPGWSRERLERTALKHAFAVSLAYDRDFDPSQTDCLTVNMLRHEFTDYDDNQSSACFMECRATLELMMAWRRPCQTTILH